MFTEITDSIRRSFRISGSKGLQITFTIVPNTVQKLIPCSITAHSIRPYSPFFSFDREGQSFNLNNGKFSFTSHCVPKLFNMKLEQWCSPFFCLAWYGKQDIYWIGFVSDFGLYRRQTSQQGTILVPDLVAPKPSRTWTSRPISFVRVILCSVDFLKM